MSDYLETALFNEVLRATNYASPDSLMMLRSVAREGRSKLSGRVISESIMLPWRLAARPRRGR